MRCEICDAEQTTADIRCASALKGICLMCAQEGDFFGFTLEETAQCVAMIRVLNAEKKMTAYQRRHMKDMES